MPASTAPGKVWKVLDITWFGHSCFRLRGRDASVITDPYERTLGLTLGRQSAEIVTISHDSPHHAASALIGGDPRVIRGPGEYEIRGVMITGVATPGERLGDGKHGRNTAYAISVDELNVCHLGDLGRTLNVDQIEALKDPDVLLIPVGGGCTIEPGQVAEVVSLLEPKLVVPMHYALDGLKVGLEAIDRFCREMGLQEIHPQARLSVTRSSLPDETTVVILEPATARRA
jgi:L-ascorbate metabolism protein UlaG (beta-lactamase superfamily)